MRKNLWYRFLIIAGCLFILVQGQAQSSFQYKSALSNINAEGLYTIELTPSIVAKSKNQLSDIRIFNDKGNQVPYILKSAQPKLEDDNFIEFPIYSIKRETDKQTHIIIQNKTHRTIEELLLVIKNTDAYRTLSLSGSDDMKQWFVITENISLNNTFVRHQEHYIQSLQLPKSSYLFFDLTINGKHLLPVNIVKVGVFNGVTRNGQFTSIPEPAIVQKDSSDHHSYISLTFNDNYLVNRLQLQVKGPKFFHRRLSINMDGTSRYSSGNLILSSGTDASYNVNTKTNKLFLIIQNDDNPPLRIHSVKAYQVSKYLVAYLVPGSKYELFLGDSTLNAPEYDLEFFEDSLQNTALQIQTGPISAIGPLKGNIKQPGSTGTVTLWIIIGCVLVFLLILTFRMTKEVEKKNEH